MCLGVVCRYRQEVGRAQIQTLEDLGFNPDSLGERSPLAGCTYVPSRLS